MKSLDKIKILDLTRLVPGPICTLLLHDLGADVIKIEDVNKGDYLRSLPPFIDKMSAAFHALNRGKKSVSVNLNDKSGLECFKMLVKKADIVIEGFRPGKLESINISFKNIKAINPEIILCSITGYGQYGGYSKRAGHDLNFLAVSGIVGLKPESFPLPIQVADVMGGIMSALQIMAAIRTRDMTGQGSHLDVNLTETSLMMLMPQLAEYTAQPEARGSFARLLTGDLPTYSVYKTADGKEETVAAIEDKFKQRFYESLKSVEKFELSENCQQTKKNLTKIFSSKKEKYWQNLFENKDTCVETTVSLDNLMNHKAFHGRNSFVELQITSDKKIMVPRTPFLDENLKVLKSRGPYQGEHTVEELLKAGVDEKSINKLIAKKILFQPNDPNIKHL